ncbi:hypothetical protein DIPPA_21888 [Diplonema papillatum]|nr:hypothetical protein DIPPA_21888 [Diplonema papillatum]
MERLFERVHKLIACDEQASTLMHLSQRYFAQLAAKMTELINICRPADGDTGDKSIVTYRDVIRPHDRIRQPQSTGEEGNATVPQFTTTGRAAAGQAALPPFADHGSTVSSLPGDGNPLQHARPVPQQQPTRIRAVPIGQAHASSGSTFRDSSASSRAALKESGSSSPLELTQLAVYDDPQAALLAHDSHRTVGSLYSSDDDNAPRSCPALGRGKSAPRSYATPCPFHPLRLAAFPPANSFS